MCACGRLTSGYNIAVYGKGSILKAEKLALPWKKLLQKSQCRLITVSLDDTISAMQVKLDARKDEYPYFLTIVNFRGQPKYRSQSHASIYPIHFKIATIILLCDTLSTLQANHGSFSSWPADTFSRWPADTFSRLTSCPVNFEWTSNKKPRFFSKWTFGHEKSTIILHHYLYITSSGVTPSPWP